MEKPKRTRKILFAAVAISEVAAFAVVFIALLSGWDYGVPALIAIFLIYPFFYVGAYLFTRGPVETSREMRKTR